MVIVDVGAGRVAATGTCRECGTAQRVECDWDGLIDWSFGKPIQEALGEITVSEAEWLVSGVCGECFDALWTKGDAA